MKDHLDKLETILRSLRMLGRSEAVAGMARFGITPEKAYGVSIPELRKLAKRIGKDHLLAQQLWAIDTRETRILASMIDDPAQVEEEQMEAWVREFSYWEICDQVCQNLFARTSFAHRKALEWAERPEEFVRRAGFAIMAWRAFQDRKAPDEVFEEYFAAIVRGATDERPMVKKAVNWALRQIGKRNSRLNRRAIDVAGHILKLDAKSARWIARDALRELTSAAVQERLRKKEAAASGSG